MNLPIHETAAKIRKNVIYAISIFALFCISIAIGNPGYIEP